MMGLKWFMRPLSYDELALDEPYADSNLENEMHWRSHPPVLQREKRQTMRPAAQL